MQTNAHSGASNQQKETFAPNDSCCWEGAFLMWPDIEAAHVVTPGTLIGLLRK